MDSFAVEFTAYRIGGSDYFERVFTPRIEQIVPGSRNYVQLQGRIRPSAMITIYTEDWTIVRPGLYSCSMAIATEEGRPLAPARPALLGMYPCDVPLHSTHIGYNTDDGVVTVGLRLPSRAWMPHHVALLDQGTPPAPTE